jgi:hypothetical protein
LFMCGTTRWGRLCFGKTMRRKPAGDRRASPIGPDRGKKGNRCAALRRRASFN